MELGSLTTVTRLREVIRRREGPDADLEEQAAQRNRLVQAFEAFERGWFWETDENGFLTYMSPRALSVLASDSNSTESIKLTDLLDDTPESSGSGRSLRYYLSARAAFTDCLVQAEAGGGLSWALSGSPRMERGYFRGYTGYALNLSEENDRAVELERLAKFDALTGLPNRTQVFSMIRNLIVASLTSSRRFAIALMDLDRFKAVNDSFGHPVGDMLLKQVAGRLREVVGDSGEAGRLGGDEFVIVLPGDLDEAAIAELCARIVEQVGRPYYINGSTLSVGASIGVARAGYEQRAAEDLIREADIALYRSKSRGRGTWTFFKKEMQTDAVVRQSFEAEFREALRAGALSLVYQPTILLESRHVAGFEALARWDSPTRGQVSPGIFIPVAEEAGLIHELGAWALRTACLEARDWPEGQYVAVNISSPHLADKRFESDLERVLSETGCPASRLELEITESLLMDGSDAVADKLRRLRDRGISIALDDFGTGYSNLDYLARLPLNKLKIDQSLVRGASEGVSRKSAIIRSIVAMAREIGLLTTAEGVETDADLEFVTKLGCTYVQGYVFSRPLVGPDARKFIVADGPETSGRSITPREPRRRLLRAAMLAHGADLYPVRVKNISTGGALIESPVEIEPGAEVSLSLEEEQWQPALVRWRRETALGLAFAAPLDLSRLVGAAKADQAAHVMPAYLAEANFESTSGGSKRRLSVRDL